MSLPKDNVIMKAPNSVVIVCVTVVLLAVIGSVLLLSLYNKDADNLIRVINTLLNALGFIAGTGSLLYAGAAARSSAKTEEKTEAVAEVSEKLANGELDETIRRAVSSAVRKENPYG